LGAQMSGWDTSSRPSWDRPEGPEDSTQAFSAPEPGTGAEDPWPGGGAAASPPPEFFPDYGQQQEPPRPSFSPEPELPRRGRHHAAAPNGAFGQDAAYVQEPPYGRDTALGRDMGYGAEVRDGQDTAHGQDIGYRPDPYGLDTTSQNPVLRQDSAKTGWTWVRPSGPAGSAPWDDDVRQDPGQEPARPRFDAAEPRFDAPEPRFDAAEPRFDAPELGRGDAGRSSFDDPETGHRGSGRLEPGRRDVSDDFNRPDGDEGRSDWGPQIPAGTGRRELEAAARMDPALQDFFSPQQPRPDLPRPGTGRRQPGATLAGSGLTGNGLAGSGQPRPGLPGSGQLRQGFPGPGLPGPGQPRPGLPGPDRPGGQAIPPVNGRRPRPDDWDAPAVPPRRADPRPPRPMPGRGPSLGGGRGRILVIVGVVAVVIIAGAYFLTQNSGPSNTDANNTPTLAPTTPAATKAATKSATKPTASPTASGPVYTLSTPATAGGYPMGQDPDFLATATTTAHSIASSVSSGGGGTVKGSPVSASYQLPTGEQVVEFVGYQGTFNPAKVKTILASLGSDPNSYPAGPNGGILGCANTPSSPSGAVCVWATTSTLGVTEFFDVSGPETLTTSEMANGAQIVVNLRSGVETKKS
jgi:hypothetical protein